MYPGLTNEVLWDQLRLASPYTINNSERSHPSVPSGSKAVRRQYNGYLVPILCLLRLLVCGGDEAPDPITIEGGPTCHNTHHSVSHGILISGHIPSARLMDFLIRPRGNSFGRFEHSRQSPAWERVVRWSGTPVRRSCLREMWRVQQTVTRVSRQLATCRTCSKG